MLALKLARRMLKIAVIAAELPRLHRKQSGKQQ